MPTRSRRSTSGVSSSSSQRAECTFSAARPIAQPALSASVTGGDRIRLDERDVRSADGNTNGVVREPELRMWNAARANSPNGGGQKLASTALALPVDLDPHAVIPSPELAPLMIATLVAARPRESTSSRHPSGRSAGEARPASLGNGDVRPARSPDGVVRRRSRARRDRSRSAERCRRDDRRALRLRSGMMNRGA